MSDVPRLAVVTKPRRSIRLITLATDGCPVFAGTRVQHRRGC